MNIKNIKEDSQKYSFFLYILFNMIGDRNMKTNGDEFDPIDYYLNELQPRLKENAEKYIDELLKKAKVNTGENEALSMK